MVESVLNRSSLPQKTAPDKNKLPRTVRSEGTG